MPIYEYRCTKCSDEIEVMQKITDRPLRKCRKCSGRLEKLISRTSFQLKGGGWYDSGYTKSPSGSGKKKSSSGSGGGSGKGSGSVEAKSASA
jgi:putative FmdB family regulatory protein